LGLSVLVGVPGTDGKLGFVAREFKRGRVSDERVDLNFLADCSWDGVVLRGRLDRAVLVVALTLMSGLDEWLDNGRFDGVNGTVRVGLRETESDIVVSI
jgi:hypothetical protein